MLLKPCSPVRTTTSLSDPLASKVPVMVAEVLWKNLVPSILTSGWGGEGGVVAPAAAFSLKVTVSGKDGKARDYTVGNAGFARAGVKTYRVKQVVLGPGGAALVFVIQKEEGDGTGVNIRYMVETVRLD